MVKSRVDGGDGCEIPIGRDDTRRVAVCVLYRNGLYRRKIDEKGVEKCGKTLEKCQILHEWGVPWSSGAGDWSRGVKKTFPTQK